MAKIAIALVCLWMLVPVTGLDARQARPESYQVQAVYLYNFGKFVTWPANAAVNKAAPFNICVLGRDPFGAVLDSLLDGESIHARPVAVRRISKIQAPMDCEILFISASQESQLDEILAAAGKAGILTVSDIPQFTRRGGMIQFVVDANKVRFAVNLRPAENAGLILSSELLKVAVEVIR